MAVLGRISAGRAGPAERALLPDTKVRSCCRLQMPTTRAAFADENRSPQCPLINGPSTSYAGAGNPGMPNAVWAGDKDSPNAPLFLRRNAILQIYVGQAPSRGWCQAQPHFEIALEAPVILIDHLQRAVEKAGLHATEHRDRLFWD